MFSTRLPTRALLLAAAVLAAACGDSDSNQPGGVLAEFRALHVTPALGPVDIEVDGAPVVTGLAYGSSSAALIIPGGRQRFVVRSGNQVLGDFEFDLASSHVNSMVISDSSPQFSSFVEPDTGLAIPTKANIRLVNVVGSNTTVPTLLDVRIHAPNANPDSVVTSSLDATIAAYWSLMYFDPGAFTIEYVPAGGDSVLTSASFDVAPGEKKAVVLSRAADGSYHVEVTLEP